MNVPIGCCSFLLIAALILAPGNSRSAFAAERGESRDAIAAQQAAIARMNADLSPLVQTVAVARNELLAASLAWPRNDAAIKAHVESLGAADRALANARAEVFAKLQTSPGKLSPAQIASLHEPDGFSAGRGGAAIPSITSNQIAMLTQMTGMLQRPTQEVKEARAALRRRVAGRPSGRSGY